MSSCLATSSRSSNNTRVSQNLAVLNDELVPTTGGGEMNTADMIKAIYNKVTRYDLTGIGYSIVEQKTGASASLSYTAEEDGTYILFGVGLSMRTNYQAVIPDITVSSNSSTILCNFSGSTGKDISGYAAYPAIRVALINCKKGETMSISTNASSNSNLFIAKSI